MNVMTRFVSSKETKCTVSSILNTRSKDRFKRTTMMKLVKAMERIQYKNKNHLFQACNAERYYQTIISVEIQRNEQRSQN